jgi:UDP-glucose 4-epimerase
MKYLVTGGAGFIGSHLSEKLLASGHTVRVLDDLSTGRLENVQSLEENDRFSLRVGTVTDPELVNQEVEDVDRVFHLAAAVGVQRIIDNPLESINVNVDGTKHVLQACNRDKTPVLVASTSEIYGKNENFPFEEGDDRVLGSITTSRWSYSCTKALDEFLGLAYWREKRLPVVIARFFNTVGPRQTGQYGMVIPRFVKQALLGRPITVYGDGQQTRAFLDVDDATDAVIDLINCEECYGEPYNIGGDERVTIEELARRIIDRVDSSSSIDYIPYEKAYEEGFEDMRHREPDVTKAREAIGFSPKYDLNGILDRIIEFFQSNEDFQ